MSSIRIDRGTLEEFYIKYLQTSESLDEVEGIYRATAYHVLKESIINKELIASDTSSYRFINYRNKETHVNYYREQVFSLLENDLTREVYGLSMSDLFNMEYYLFLDVKKKVVELQTKRMEEMENLKKNKYKEK
jgi:hypothetical protein